MNTKKIFVGGIAGGIVYFLLGWVTYGMLLSDYMHSHSGVKNTDRGDDMIFWALIIGNLSLGFLLSYIINKAVTASVASGFVTGGVVGFLFSAGFDFITYGTTTITSLHQIAADVAAFTVLSAIVGAVVALVSRPGARVATA